MTFLAFIGYPNFTPLGKLQCFKQCILVRLVLTGMAVNGLLKYPNIKYLCVCV